jgi:hypothetical protein
VSWKWLLVALATAAIVWFIVFALRSGSCVDYVQGASVCSTGPAVGWPGAWFIGILGVSVAGYAIIRAFRHR